MEPAFRGSACRESLALLVRELEEEADKSANSGSVYTWRKACLTLRRCVELSFPGLGGTAMRFLAASERHALPHLAVALGRLVGPTCVERVFAQFSVELAYSPLLVEELRVAACLDLSANILLADLASRHQLALEAETGEGRYRLSDCAPDPAFAEIGLKQAAERVRVNER